MIESLWPNVDAAELGYHQASKINSSLILMSIGVEQILQLKQMDLDLNYLKRNFFCLFARSSFMDFLGFSTCPPNRVNE